MKLLFVGANGIETIDATSVITMDFLNYYVKRKGDIDCVTFALGDKNSKNIVNGLIESVTVESPLKKGKISSYRALSKAKALLHLDRGTVLSRFCLRRIKKLFKKRDFDCIVAVSGRFDYAEAAYRFAKKRKLPFVLICFDSYSLSPFVKMRRPRFKREKRWTDYATRVFLDRDSAKSPFEENSCKIEHFSTPIFPRDHKYNQNGDIVFGGIFYDSFRPINILNDFLTNPASLKETFAIYTPSKNEIANRPNVKSFNRVRKTEYSKICSKSKAIIVIGNGDKTSVMPSKFYDALAYKVPLICLNFGPMQKEIEKLPLCYSGYDPDCLKKIDSVSQESLNEIDMFKLMPERNPEVLAEIFDRLLAEIEAQE